MVDGIRKKIKGLPPRRRQKIGKNHKRRRMKLKKYMKLIGGGMIGYSNYIGTSLNVLTQEVKLKGKIPFQFLHFFYINNGDRTSHWVGH